MTSQKEFAQWSKMQECGTFMGLSIMLWIYRIAGIRAMYFTLYFVVAFYFIGSTNARRSSLEYLRRMHAYRGSASPWKQRPGLRVSFAHFMTFARCACDKIIVWLGHYKPEDITLTGYEKYQALKDNKTGCLLLVSHLGNIDLCRAFAGSFKDIPLTILVHNAHAPNFFKMMQKVARKNTTIDMIEVSEITPDVIIRLREKIAAGENVAIAADRTAVESDNRYEIIPFLGDDALFAQGPFILADLLDCPVFSIFTMKEGQRYHAYFTYIADTLKVDRKNRQQEIRSHIKSYVEHLEYYAVKYPLQWFNFYPYWNKPE